VFPPDARASAATSQMRWHWPWQRRREQPRPATTDDDAALDASHRATVRDIDARSERVREFVDAVDLLQGPTKEGDRT
jgi:hypothetical protein